MALSMHAMRAPRIQLATGLRHAPSRLTRRPAFSLDYMCSRRLYASDGTTAVEPPDFLDQGERKVFEMIKDGLNPTKLEVSRLFPLSPTPLRSRDGGAHDDPAAQVQDVSGGCGSMYALDIVSEQFKGLPMIKQHRLVNSVLGDEVKKWHGLQLKTKAP